MNYLNKIDGSILVTISKYRIQRFSKYFERKAFQLLLSSSTSKFQSNTDVIAKRPTIWFLKAIQWYWTIAQPLAFLAISIQSSPILQNRTNLTRQEALLSSMIVTFCSDFQNCISRQPLPHSTQSQYDWKSQEEMNLIFTSKVQDP